MGHLVELGGQARPGGRREGFRHLVGGLVGHQVGPPTAPRSGPGTTYAYT